MGLLTRRLYIQIYLTVLGTLVLVVLLAGLIWNMFARDRFNQDVFEIVGSLAYLSLPAAEAPSIEQRMAVDRLSRELDIDITLFDSNRELIAASGIPAPQPRAERGRHRGRWKRQRRQHEWLLHLPDGRWLVADVHRRGGPPPLWRLLVFLGVIALGVGLGAYPLVRRLTRRLERLQRGVEKIGSGALGTRIEIAGRDEIAQLANSFNEAAEKIQSLLAGHRMLLANASHELRTPLSRIRMGVELLKDGDVERREALNQDIAELDELIDEILLMSRLDAGGQIESGGTVDLVALAAEEAARYPECQLSGTAPAIGGDDRLLRRLIRNLLDNANVHGATPIRIVLATEPGMATLTVHDGGDGIAEAEHEAVFQPFYRGRDRQNTHGYGLGLALVRQIAEAHGGTVRVLPNAEFGSAIRVELPL